MNNAPTNSWTLNDSQMKWSNSRTFGDRYEPWLKKSCSLKKISNKCDNAQISPTFCICPVSSREIYKTDKHSQMSEPCLVNTLNTTDLCIYSLLFSNKTFTRTPCTANIMVRFRQWKNGPAHLYAYFKYEFNIAAENEEDRAAKNTKERPNKFRRKVESKANNR